MKEDDMPGKKKMSDRRLKSSASVRLAKATLEDPKSTAFQKKYAKIVLKGGNDLMLTADRGTKLGSDTIFKMDKRELYKPKPPAPEPKKVKAKTRPKIKVDTTPGKNRPSRKVITPFVIKKAKKK
jgi:hypothetical protein